MKTTINKKIITAATALAMAGSFAVALPAFADTDSGPGGVNINASAQVQMGRGQPGMGMGFGRGQGEGEGRGGPGGMMPQGVRPAAFGTVTAINGNIITIASRQGFGSTTSTTTITVDATNATVVKNNATSTLSAVTVGDMIAVQGTLSGTNIVATSIHDGVRPGFQGRGGEMRDKNENDKMGSSTMPAIGNGQPVVAGTVASVSGSSLTITTKSNVTYTVDASSAKILAGGQQTATISNVAVGDEVLVQGTINGTSVIASSVIDQSHASSTSSHEGGAGEKAPPRGFFGGVGQFFMHLFGF